MALPIRWRLTLWYGAAVGAIVGLFAIATYVPYRSAALRAFDIDLRDNLDTLQNAYGEEVREAVARGSSDPMQSAANEAVDAFQLNRLYTEIRTGKLAETRLAQIPAAGVRAGEPILPDSEWARIATSFRPNVVVLTGGRRGIARTYLPAGRRERITLFVADKTTIVDQTLSSIRTSLLEFGIVGLLLALAGGYWVARRVLRPIAVFTAQAAAMAGEPSAGARLEIQNQKDELGRLGVSFNRLLEQIEQSAERTRAFIADAAHELKTPVAIVRTEAELALSSDRTLSESREALAAIGAESTRLSRLVSDLTLLAEGETLQHPLERRLVDLTELVHEVVRSLRSLAASKNATIEVEAEETMELRGDERLLRQILVNLVENAIKFSRPPARIGIVLCRENGHVAVRVLDQATTLSADERERVFERFYRSSRERRDSSGNGLGLAIVRWAVGLHGGRIRVEPRSALGNEFIAEFPLTPAPTSPRPQ
ncbi:MAG TPA: ATP-binding protein [Thermoanaerobaculia bacterium]|jgi:signal transduction histidine kinase|nr:ATP-binding protein [Thermoanaerobaculia bacterium]